MDQTKTYFQLIDSVLLFSFNKLRACQINFLEFTSLCVG